MLSDCDAGQDSWESLGQQGDQTSHPTGNQLWIFIGGTDAEAEAPTLWPLDAKSRLIRKDSDAGKDWRQKEKRAAEDEMVAQHHWFKGHELEQTLGGSEGQGSLACYIQSMESQSQTRLSDWTTVTRRKKEISTLYLHKNKLLIMEDFYIRN